eukprot:9695601-Lingulodinium_polyedra.AAC.1
MGSRQCSAHAVASRRPVAALPRPTMAQLPDDGACVDVRREDTPRRAPKHVGPPEVCGRYV